LRDLAVADGQKAALLVGTEGAGLSRDAIAAADVAVRIPMAAGIDSLNVATAAGIAFWELSRS
jgi:tRNA G18 (ribose-2'-O)-methylase SpoU